jgi:hypothetical protein
MLRTKAAEKNLISYVVVIMGRFLPLTFGVAPDGKFTRKAAVAAVWEHPQTSLQCVWK